MKKRWAHRDASRRTGFHGFKEQEASCPDDSGDRAWEAEPGFHSGPGECRGRRFTGRIGRKNRGDSLEAHRPTRRDGVRRARRRHSQIVLTCIQRWALECLSRFHRHRGNTSPLSQTAQESLLYERLLPGLAWSKPFGDHTVWLRYFYIAKRDPSTFGLGGYPKEWLKAMPFYLSSLTNSTPLFLPHSVSKSRTV